MKTIKSKCKCCNSDIEVYTKNELLQIANNTLDNNTYVNNILKIFDLTKDDVSYAQNRSREIGYNNENLKIIKSGINKDIFVIVFNQTLTKITDISIATRYFDYTIKDNYNMESATIIFNNLFKFLDLKVNNFKLTIADEAPNDIKDSLNER